MILARLVTRVGVVVGVAVVLATAVTVGPERRRAVRRELRPRLRGAAPYLGLLAGVLLFNKVARQVGPEVSWLLGWNVTGVIYAVEGTFVAELQALATPALTTYFSAVYVYGYVFLLVFPLVAYFALPDLDALRTAALAYATNHTVGLVCYVLFIAYGPRNLMPDLVDSLLYVSWPESKLLTTRVNTNTNVFPSLHTSLAVTVAILAYRTRDAYPRWRYVAAALAASVVVSTMYLGIHWATDVVAGVGLAVISVSVATVVVSGSGVTWRTVGDRLRGGSRHAFGVVRRRLERER